MENYYPMPKKNWFQRNWKWFVPTGCLTLLIIFGLLITSIVFGVTSMMKNSDVYKHSLEVAQKDPQLIEIIGTNIKNDGLVSGNISIRNSSGDAELDIPIKGSKGNGIIHVVAYKEAGAWVYTTLIFDKKGSHERIDLLEQYP